MRLGLSVLLALTACTSSPVSPASTSVPAGTSPSIALATTTTSVTLNVQRNEQTHDFTTEVELDDLPGQILVSRSNTVSMVTPRGDQVWTEAVSNPNSQATWSYRGDVAYADFIDSQPVIVVIRPDTSRQVMETEIVPFYFHWDPEGGSVGFLGSGSNGLLAGLASPGVNEVRLIDRGGPFYFDWHPAGGRFIAHVGARELREYDLVSGDTFTQVAPTGTFQAPQWTTQGVVYGQPGRVSITASGLSRRIQSSATDVMVGTPGGDSVRIATAQGSVSFSASSNGMIAISEPESLSVVEADGSTTAVSDNLILAFQWSPNGQYLAYLEQVDNDLSFRWVIWTESEEVAFDAFLPSPTFFNVYVPFWDQYSRSMTIWSPDSKAIVYSAAVGLESEEGEIFIQPISSSQSATSFGPGDFASWSLVR